MIDDRLTTGECTRITCARDPLIVESIATFVRHLFVVLHVAASSQTISHHQQRDVSMRQKSARANVCGWNVFIT